MTAAVEGTFAFVVDADPATAPHDRQVHAASRLGHALTRVGYRVVLGRAPGWTPPDGLVAVITTTPRFDPAVVPDDVPSLAWVIDHPMSWPGHPALALFDAVLAGSSLMRDRLQVALTGAGTTPLLDVLPLAADPAGAPSRARPAPAAAPGLRAAARALLRGGTPAAGTRSGTDTGPVTVTDPVWAVGGIVPAALYETLTDGRLPRPGCRLGLAEVGLEALAPHPVPPEGSGEPDVAALQRHVFAEHTWMVRASALLVTLARITAAHEAARPPRIGFFPDFRSTNPYQDLLYAELVARGARIAPLRRVTESLVLRDTGGDLTDYVLHVHWAEAVAQVVEDPAEAADRLAAFRDLLLAVKERGATVAWTVHNVLPHDVRHRDLEIELCRLLARHADLVHVMGEATPALTAGLYELDPATVELVPHSSYDGVYPDVISRAAARRRLGVLDHDVALLALGGIRPYRGLDTLLAAFDDLLERDLRVKLLVAGKPGAAPQVAEWVAACEAHPRIVARFEHVPESDLQLWHRAADIAVLPYRGILNSGAFKLAETFGLPVVAPRAGNLAALLDPAHTRGFDPDTPGDLLRALIDAVDLVTDPGATARATAAARTTAAAYPPGRMAADFADVLARRSGVGALTARPVAGDRQALVTAVTGE